MALAVCRSSLQTQGAGRGRTLATAASRPAPSPPPGRGHVTAEKSRGKVTGAPPPCWRVRGARILFHRPSPRRPSGARAAAAIPVRRPGATDPLCPGTDVADNKTASRHRASKGFTAKPKGDKK